MRILAISGSLRRDSYNTRLLRAAAELAPPGIELELYDGLGALPPYNAELDVEPAPAPVQDLRDRVAAADAVLISTPEYNGSLPGQLKTAIDWASRPFPESSLRNKPVAIMGASVTAYGATWAQTDLKRVLGTAGARVVGEELPGRPRSRALRRRGTAHRPRPPLASRRAPRAARSRGAPGGRHGLATGREKGRGPVSRPSSSVTSLGVVGALPAGPWSGGAARSPPRWLGGSLWSRGHAPTD